jgi:hypothetical protein
MLRKAKYREARPFRGDQGSWYSFRCLQFAVLARRERLGEQRFKQAEAGFVGGSKARFQPVAQRHQFIDLGDDAALFG